MNTNSFLVITEVSFAESLKATMENLGKKFAQICAKQAGFRSINFISSHNGKHTRSIIEWESKAHHEACMQSPDFNQFNDEWEKHTKNGAITFSINTYDILESL